jgi:hypothetical protein
MSRKYDTPRINEESKTALIKKRKLWKKYKYNRNPLNKKKYEEARNEANRLVRKAKYEQISATDHRYLLGPILIPNLYY